VADFGINRVEALDQSSYLVSELRFKESHLLVCCTLSAHKQPPLLRNIVPPLSGSSSRQLLGLEILEPSSAVL